MPYSNDGNAIKNLHLQYKKYGLRRLLTEIEEIKWNKWAFNSLLKKIRETESTDRRHGSGRPKHARTEENVTTDHCWWTGTKPGRPATNTSFNTPGIQRDRSNTIQWRTYHLLRSWPLAWTFISLRKVNVRTNWLQLLLVLLTLMFHKVV